MYQSNWSFNIPPSGNPRAFELLKSGLFKFPPPGAKKPFKCPTLWYWATSSQRQISSSTNTIHDFQRDLCYNNTFKLLLKTLLRKVLTNKGEILSWKSDKPAKTVKTHGHITLEQEIKLVQIPHPSKATFKFPPPRTRCTVWGDVEASIWPAHYQW